MIKMALKQELEKHVRSLDKNLKKQDLIDSYSKKSNKPKLWAVVCLIVMTLTALYLGSILLSNNVEITIIEKPVTKITHQVEVVRENVVVNETVVEHKNKITKEELEYLNNEVLN